MRGTFAPLAFTLHDVREYLGAEIMARGERLVRDGHVTGLDIYDKGNSIVALIDGDDHKVLNSVMVYIARRYSRTLLHGACTCSASVDCEHVAATLLAALQRSVGPATRKAVPVAPVRSRNKVQTEDPAVEMWLSDLQRIVAPESDEPIAGDERIAYIFGGSTMIAQRAFPVQIIVVRRAKTQRWTKVRDTNSESLINATARAVGSADMIIGRFLRGYEGTYRERESLAEEIVQRMVSTGRAHLDRFDTLPLTLAPPRPARLAWALDGEGKQRCTVTFEDPNLRVLPGHSTWWVDPQTGATGPIEAGIPGRALGALLLAPPLDTKQAVRVREAFASTMPELALPAPLEITERIIKVKPVPRLTLRSVSVPAAPSHMWGITSSVAHTLDIAELTFMYGDATVNPASRALDVRFTQGTDILVYPRSQSDENRLMSRLGQFEFENDQGSRQLLDGSGLFLRFSGDGKTRWVAFIHRHIPELRAEGWRVEIEPGFRHDIIDLTSDDVWHTEVVERADGWFDLAIGLDIEGNRIALLPLLRDLMLQVDVLGDPAALESITHDGAFYVTDSTSGKTLAFPAERLMAIIATLVELGDPDGLNADGRLRLPRVRALVVDELAAASGLRWDVPEHLRELGERMRGFAKMTRIAVPKSFDGTLREYQREGLDWLQFLAKNGLGGILADDMGLGKSVQTLAHLLCEKEAGRLAEPVLLIVPTSLVHNWCDEAARFTPGLRVLPLHGALRGQRFDDIPKHDLIVTTYALLVRDAVLRERAWHAVIFDEAQVLKNPQSKAAQVAMGLRAEHRLCLTGTPVENHLGDLWSLFSITLPGALGSRKQFTRIFRTPIEKRGDLGRRRALANRVGPFLLRRTKEAVARELPEKTEIVQRVELVGAQRDLYEAVRISMEKRVRDEIATRGLARSQIVILDALLKLRQVCCDPRLLPPRLRKTTESVKLDLLLEMLPQMIEEGRRVLLFSQFTSMLDLIAPALEGLKIPFVTLTGQTKDRASVVKRFQSGAVPVFLISLKAGGTGLNLTAADTVIHYDPWWNPAVERQATDRAHRIGQTQHVFVYKLIGVGTVEEKIVELQARKAKLAEAIFSEKVGTAARFGAEDVARLFAPLDDSHVTPITTKAAPPKRRSQT